ncbi:MAG: phage tail tape measure protein [Oscillospiraceae bacterium]
MADSVTSQVQHITALDFDMTKALQQLQELQDRFNAVTQEIASRNWTINAVINGDEELNRLQNQAASVASQINNLETEINNYNTVIVNNFSQVNQELNQTANTFNVARNAADNYRDGLDDTNNATDGLNNTTSTLISTIETRLVSALSQAAKAGYEAVKSTEDSMVEIGRVLDTTASETETLRGSLFELGNEYGRSFEDVSDVALRFAQAGYNMNDTISNTKALLLGMNTAELEASSGTTELIGIMSQWGMTADELVTIIDKLNYTADNNAITTQDLADALLKASSMAKTAGMNFDDTVGVLTAMKVASGAAGKEVGNAFKSIIAYIQRPESLKLFDNMGIDVFKDKVTGELLPMMDILKSMTEKWNGNQEEMLNTLIKSGDAAQMMSEEWAIATDTLDEYNQYQEAAAAATDKANDAESRAQAQAAAGVFRRNYYIALMENFNKAIEVSADLINSEGHSAAENARYMETLTAKTEQLVVSLTELAVAAADAGLLDLAKSAIDTATAITKWTTETKNFIPILSTVSGLLITIKSQKIAEEFNAIGGALKNTGKSFIAGINAIRGVETAASGATAAASGLSSALGVFGIALTVFNGVTTAINAYKQSIEQARQETIDAAESEKEKYEILEQSKNIYDELSERYEELRTKTYLTAEEETELDNITAQLTETQDKLTEAYRSQADSIDLINGKRDEQIEKLNKLNEKELQYLRNTQKEAIKAKKIKNNQSDTVVTGQYELEDQSGLDSIISSNFNVLNGAKFTISESFGKSKIEVQATTESLEDLKTVLKEIEESGGKNTAEWSMFYEAIRGVESELQNTKDLYADLAETEFSLYSIENNFEDVGREGYLDWRNGLLEAAEGDTELENALAELFAKKYPKQDYLADIEATKNMTTAEKAYYFAKKNSANVTESSAKAAKTYSKAAEETAEVIGLTDEELKKLASTISDAESNITDLNKYMETLAEGNGLTAKEVMELCETYGLLADQFTLTEKGYTIEVSALEELRDKQIETAVTARLEQAGYTEEVVANILKRIQAYSDEVKGISSVADAQLALEKLKLQLSDTQSNVHISSPYEAKQYGEQVDDLRELIGQTEGYAETLEYLDNLQNDLYKNLGKSFSYNKKETDEAEKAAKEADKAFKALVESIERLGEMGVYSLEETIDKFEELRHTAGYTEDQIKTIEDKLRELYESQIDEHLKAAEQEKKDYIDSVKEKYDADKEALKKLLEEEMDMFKEQQEDELDARKKYWEDELDNLKANLNAQISASKKAYEAKKKLAEKSYDSQREALESLRDYEIESIKSSYNEQIRALQKIKSARQADRDEDDYNDERAELLKQLSYWEQRTGTEAVENIEKLKKQIEELDKKRQREVEDKEIDDEIDDLEYNRDKEISAVKARYAEQLAALKEAKENELEVYEAAYNAEQELLKAKLEKEVKAMEEARDADLKAFKRSQEEKLKLLEEEQEQKLQDLEDEKEAAIKAAEEKWEQIEEIFNDSNKAMVASAGMFASDLYDQFDQEFTKKFEMDLEHLRSLISQLNSQRSSWESMSGTTPETSYTKNVSNKRKEYGSSSWIKNKVVKASTGGKTTADGMVMLHKNELIINPPTTKKLEDLLETLSMPKTGIVIDPSLIRRINKSAEFFHAPRENSYNTNNNYNSNSYDNSRPIIQNFNAPLQNIENIEDAADMEAATNAIERKIMRELSTKL